MAVSKPWIYSPCMLYSLSTRPAMCFNSFLEDTYFLGLLFCYPLNKIPSCLVSYVYWQYTHIFLVPFLTNAYSQYLGLDSWMKHHPTKLDGKPDFTL